MTENIQAVILAAGKSTRTYPLTLGTPKPMLKLLDKSIMEHNLDELKKLGRINEVLIIVGYLKEQIMEKIGFEYKGMKIRYIMQKEQKGTGAALKLCEEYLKGKFIVLSGDDIYSSKDLSKLLKHDYCLLGKKVENPEQFGILTINNLTVEKITEKPVSPDSDIASIGVYLFDQKVFDAEIAVSERNEIEIVDYVTFLIKEGKKVKCEIVEDYWIPMTYPWSYLEANVFMLKRKAEKISKEKEKTMIKGDLGENVTITGDVFIEEGAIIKPHTHIEGPAYIGKNCRIGPFCHIRPDTIIMDGCEIGKTELYDIVIMDSSVSKHFSYLAHSVIGKNVNIGAGTITADYRHDSKNNMTIIKGKKIDSGRRKLGAFIGDNVRTGIGTLIYPGRKLWNDTSTLPGEIVKKDKEE